MKKVSVWMITYNHSKYIRQSIDSVLRQNTNFEYEIIIGDDGSTDGTKDILVEYRNKYPDKIKLLIEEKNKGIKDNVFKTYQACNGEYIALLEGDDYWIDDNKLQKQVDFLDNNKDYSSCFSRVKVIYENNKELSSFLPLKELEKTEFETEYILKNFFIPTLTVMFRKSSLEFPSWFNDINTVFDYPMHVMRSKHGKLKMLDGIMGVYRKHDGGATNNINEKWNLDFIHIYTNLNSELNYKYDSFIKSRIANEYLELSIKAINDNNKVAYKNYLKNAIELNSSYNSSKKMIFVKLLNILGKPLVNILYKYINYKKLSGIKKGTAW